MESPEKKEEKKEKKEEKKEEKIKVVAFVNFNSGGKMGNQVALTLQSLLGKENVFNLADGGPRPGLEKHASNPNLRVVFCGGDGTVNWGLSTLNLMRLSIPVGIIPLGTGNDLARQFEWGHKYPGEDGIRRILRQIQAPECKTEQFDRWKVIIQRPQPVQGGPFATKREVVDGKEIIECEWNNYLSFGVDAQIMQEFHHHRESHRGCYCCRCCTMAWLGCFGLVNCCCCMSHDLPFSLEIKRNSESEWEEVKKMEHFQGLIFLNLETYAGGRRIWPEEASARQSTSDGLFEVLGVDSSFHLGRMVSEMSKGVRIAQVVAARVTTRVSSFVQMDGEPWQETPAVFEVTRLPQAVMLVGQPEDTCCS